MKNHPRTLQCNAMFKFALYLHRHLTDDLHINSLSQHLQAMAVMSHSSHFPVVDVPTHHTKLPGDPQIISEKQEGTM